jgi:hypothetical protein
MYVWMKWKRIHQHTAEHVLAIITLTKWGLATLFRRLLWASSSLRVALLLGYAIIAVRPALYCRMSRGSNSSSCKESGQ